MIKKVPSVKIKKKKTCRQKWLHINVHTLIPRVCDILPLHDRRDFEDGIKLSDLEMRKCPG